MVHSEDLIHLETGADLARKLTKAASYLESHEDTEPPEGFETMIYPDDNETIEAELETLLGELSRYRDSKHVDFDEFCTESKLEKIFEAAEHLNLDYDQLHRDKTGLYEDPNTAKQRIV